MKWFTDIGKQGEYRVEVIAQIRAFAAVACPIWCSVFSSVCPKDCFILHLAHYFGLAHNLQITVYVYYFNGELDEPIYNPSCCLTPTEELQKLGFLPFSHFEPFLRQDFVLKE